MTTTSKKCTKCGEVKALNEFSADRRKKDGKQSSCKDCHKQIDKRYREQNREKRHQYYEQNREKRLEYARQYYKQNSEKRNEYYRQWLEQNREKRLEYNRQYNEQNREKRLEYARQYYARQKAMREFFRMHKALAEITEALQQYTQP